MHSLQKRNQHRHADRQNRELAENPDLPGQSTVPGILADIRRKFRHIGDADNFQQRLDVGGMDREIPTVRI